MKGTCIYSSNVRYSTMHRKSIYLTLIIGLFGLTSLAQQPILYLSCANKLDLKEIGLKPQLKTLGFRGGQIVEGRGAGDVIYVEPTAIGFDIQGVSAQTGDDTTVNFRARRPPQPTFSLMFNGAPVSPTNTPGRDEMATFQLIPDPTFAANYPEEANYQFDGVSHWINPALGAPMKLGTFSDPTPTIQIQGSNLSQEGLYFQIDGISRINYRGEVIKEPFPKSKLNYVLNR